MIWEAAFVWRAIMAGVGVALVAGPLGCFVVWRRMAYFGTALAHNAFLGIALGVVLGIDPMFGIAAAAIVVALLLVLLQRQHVLADDTLMGILAHGGMATGLVVLSFLTGLRVDLLTYLFGDVLAVSWTDLLWIYGAGAVTLGALVALWRWLLMVSVHAELAAAEGIPVLLVRLAFMLMLAVLVAIAMKIVGILLITSMLIIPAAAARRLADTPETMAVYAAGAGVLAVLGGMAGSMTWDIPSGPAIVVVAAILFALAQTVGGLRGLVRRSAG
ncbi:zinc transport system permease protein [Limimonas halophila]|uniref:High-affinity zinc uptake system membrane protein ZnuB n=1 Tax=Limimonas halophila TaxID=1082479 RepID=A0A1G7M7S3_9PROT|nr:metal ABC transporter permease [Limimonas halophila]SDF57735.1 zinc transport system permease protein [Limimonas halophila]